MKGGIKYWRLFSLYRHPLIQFCIWMVACLGSTIASLAQSDGLKFKHLSIEQGLSHKDVTVVLQDSKGFIWFGTKNGLNMYDGYTIQSYFYNPDQPNGIPSNDIRALAEDKEGYLWVGTYDSGVIRIDRTTQKGIVYNTLNTKALKSNVISDIYTDKDGNIWIGTFGGGLAIFDLKTKTFVSYQNDPANAYSISSNNIITIHQNRDGTLWLGTFGGGLCKFDPKKKLFYRYLRENTTDIYTIEEDRHGYLWLGTYGKGLVRFDARTETADYFSTASNKNLGSDYIRSIKEDAVGVLWIGTEKEGGLTYFDPSRKQFYTYRKDATRPSSLANNNINNLLLDRLGVLWIGTENGIDQIDTQNAAFHITVSGTGPAPKFTDGSVNALYEDRAQILWVGGTLSDKLSLYAFNRYQNTYTEYRLPVSQVTQTVNYTINAIAEDELGNIWIGTAESGLYKLNKETKKITQYTQTNSELSSNGIETLYKDKKGILWIGTYEGGLCRFDPQNKTFRTYLNNPKDPFSIVGNTVKVIYEDTYGKLWIGTRENGLSMFDPDMNFFRSFVHDPQSIRSLSSNSIRAITESFGEMWIGTDAGICKYEPEGNLFLRINNRNGLPDNEVCGMLTDKKGDIWISMFSKGLTRFNPKGYSFRYFTINEGLHSNEFQQWAAHKSYSGDLFFGGSKHFISFSPDQLIDSHYEAPVYITSFLLFNKKKEFNAPLYQLPVIELNYKDNFFELEFTFLNYLDVDKNMYAYKMEGVDQDWKNIGNRRSASYTNLDPGEYTFRVRAANKYNRWNKKEATIQIIIHPAWYQTWWARLGAIVLVIGSFLMYYRSRIRFLQRQKIILEGLVNERTAELIQKNEEIEAQKNSIEEKNIRLTDANELIEQINEELRAINNDLEYRVEQRTHQLSVVNENLIKSNQELDMFIYRASHDIKGPLASLSGLCKVASMDVQDTKAREYFSLLDKTCDKANHTLVRILKMYDIRNAEICYESLSVKEIVEEYGTELQKLPAYQHIKFEVKTTGVTVIESDKTLLQIILTNLIENAFRYHLDIPAGYVRIFLEEDEHSLHIRIHDNGIGIAEKLRPKLFTMFFRGTVSSSGTGLGLYISKLAIERLGGKLLFRSDFEKETAFELIVPKTAVEPTDMPMSPQQIEDSASEKEHINH